MPKSVPVLLIAVVVGILLFIGGLIKCCMQYMDNERDSENSNNRRRRHRARTYRQIQTSQEFRPPFEAVDDVLTRDHNTTATPVVVPPYPVEARHPTPQTVPLSSGFATHNLPYPTHNPHPTPASFYPAPPVGVAPYTPMTTPYPPAINSTPYPPAGPPVATAAPYPDYSANPPSYSEAVSQPPVQPPPINEGYSKQSPYNPNY